MSLDSEVTGIVTHATGRMRRLQDALQEIVSLWDSENPDLYVERIVVDYRLKSFAGRLIGPDVEVHCSVQPSVK